MTSIGRRAVLAASAALVGVAILATDAPAGEEDWTIARQWNEELLNAIRNDYAFPTVHARNLYHTSAAMYDAWAAFDPVADGVFSMEFASADDVEAARHEAISFAAYRVISHRFADSPGKKNVLPSIEALMDSYGYDTDYDELEGDNPAALGNRCAAAVIEHGMSDGANEPGGYEPPDYEPLNPPLIVDEPGNPEMIYPNHWQPLSLEYFIDQFGNPIPITEQSFLTPHWGDVGSFSLSADDEHPDKPGVFHDPGHPPYFDTETHDEFIATFIDVVKKSATLDPDSGEYIDISPGAMGNNPLGTNDGDGHDINPYTGKPYDENIVKMGDFSRVIAEFWADGPLSSAPPGHWNEIANKVSDSPLLEKRIGGSGPIVDDLEWDIKLYLALNGAVHDAGIGAWGSKGYYDYVRPIAAIRYMAELGQSSDPKLPSYHPNGLPLIDGHVELITEETAGPGGHHEHLSEYIGEVAVLSWPGEPEDKKTEYSGVEWIRAKEWLPYQLSTFVTPPFAGYVSGHSTFSRSAAEVMTEFTGDEYFPGGMGGYTLEPGWLEFEFGPTETIELQWATYYDASDQASQSRIYGGIHPWVDDFPGRIMGSEIGQGSYERAMYYFKGQVECRADLSRDGRISGDDLGRLLANWGPCPRSGECVADLTQSGDVGVEDLQVLLEGWGECLDPDEL